MKIEAKKRNRKEFRIGNANVAIGVWVLWLCIAVGMLSGCVREEEEKGKNPGVTGQIESWENEQPKVQTDGQTLGQAEGMSPDLSGLATEKKPQGIKVPPMERLEDFTFDRAAVLAERASAVVVNVGCGSAEKAVGMTSGSGVIYEECDGRLCVVTAAHVLRQDDEKCYWIKHGEETLECDSWRIAQDCDLAFLWVSTESLQEDFIKELRTAVWDKETYDTADSGDTVMCLGRRGGEMLVYEGTLESAWIYVEDFEQYMMVARCPVYPGMSGGALCDELGNLMGIVCAGNNDGELVAVPFAIVQARYEECAGI